MNRYIYRYLLFFVAVLLLWNTRIIYPLKILTVFLHELGHAFASLIVGGTFYEIHIDALEGGYTLISSNSRISQFFIISSGYIGSAILGAIILVSAHGENIRRFMLQGIGILLVGISIFYSKIFSFTMLFSLLFLVFAFLLKKLDNDRVNQGILEVMGLTSLMYALIDIWDDTIRRRGQPSDAYRLYEITHIPTIIWGVLWIFITLIITYNTFQLIHVISLRKRRI